MKEGGIQFQKASVKHAPHCVTAVDQMLIIFSGVTKDEMRYLLELICPAAEM
jgi:hypothetical protein